MSKKLSTAKPIPKKAIPPASYHPDKPNLDTAETAWVISKHVDTLRRLQKLGLGPPFSINADGTIIYSRAVVEEWLRSRSFTNPLQAIELLRRERAMRRRAGRAKEVSDA
ncbi:MAG: hypothetical protein KDC98_12910 [Planctomycetes bacterium]|nr:hypothetical protein [Planctomycetota bacterium]